MQPVAKKRSSHSHWNFLSHHFSLSSLSPELLFLLLFLYFLFLPVFNLPHFTFHTFIFKCAICLLMCANMLNLQHGVDWAVPLSPPAHALNSPVASPFRVPDFFTLTFFFVSVHTCAHTCNIFVIYLHPNPWTHTQNKRYVYTDGLSRCFSTCSSQATSWTPAIYQTAKTKNPSLSLRLTGFRIKAINQKSSETCCTEYQLSDATWSRIVSESRVWQTWLDVSFIKRVKGNRAGSRRTFLLQFGCFSFHFSQFIVNYLKPIKYIFPYIYFPCVNCF